MTNGKVLLKHNVFLFALKYAANVETLTTGLMILLGINWPSTDVSTL
jgi:hypothetical protein